MKHFKAILLLPLILSLYSCSSIEEITLEAKYVFNHAFDKDNNPIAVLLFDEAYLSSSLNIKYDSTSIIGGDRLNIKFIGELYYQETYPATLVLDGELVSYSISNTYYTKLPSSSIREIHKELKYVITDKEGHYISIDSYEGEEVYATFSKDKEIPCKDGNQCGPQPFPINAIYSFEPR
ncbi:MAG: hypothetical protein SO187_04680 [Bacilli bacterium]|nr:hypothetical protein [Bacilli bacterium]